MQTVTIYEEFRTTFGHILTIERIDSLKVNDHVKDDAGRTFVIKAIKLFPDPYHDNMVDIIVEEIDSHKKYMDETLIFK